MLSIIYVGFAPEKEEDLKNLFQDIANEQRWDGNHSWQGSYLGSSITINLRNKFFNKSSHQLKICDKELTLLSPPESWHAVWK
jgi:hypothetical protein